MNLVKTIKQEILKQELKISNNKLHIDETVRTIYEMTAEEAIRNHEDKLKHLENIKRILTKEYQDKVKEEIQRLTDELNKYDKEYKKLKAIKKKLDKRKLKKSMR